MAFLVFFFCGAAGGLLGGMGMGGGTLLIPLLTLFCGVEQAAAQGINLVSFLPMSVLALTVHAKSGLLKREKLAFMIVPAFLFSALFSFAAAFFPGETLRRAFGVFLSALALVQFSAAFRAKEGKKIP